MLVWVGKHTYLVSGLSEWGCTLKQYCVTTWNVLPANLSHGSFPAAHTDWYTSLYCLPPHRSQQDACCWCSPCHIVPPLWANPGVLLRGHFLLRAHMEGSPEEAELWRQHCISILHFGGVRLLHGLRHARLRPSRKNQCLPCGHQVSTGQQLHSYT